VRKIINICLISLLLLGSAFLNAASNVDLNTEEKSPLRVLTWEGYVTDKDISHVNQILDQQGYHYEIDIISPLAEGAEQMFDLIRGNKTDIAFLTLFFIKMENEQTSRFLQAINTQSPRLKNYKHLLPSLKDLPMGLSEDDIGGKKQPLYIPWGGGAYGFYVNRKQVAAADVPTSVKDLWLPRWKGQFSLNQSQSWYNIGLTLMAMDKSPFHLHELVKVNQRKEILALMSSTSLLQKGLNDLYSNVGHLWKASPEFHENLQIVSSWGPEITRENSKGGNWQLIDFKEGHMVWLDTINFVKGLTGKKLEAAEIFANYFIGKEVQARITKELSMVAASSLVEANELFGDRNKIFNEEMFVPPYDAISYSIMQKMVNRAERFIP
jgi:spermidine/putrescine-binding protein